MFTNSMHYYILHTVLGTVSLIAFFVQSIIGFHVYQSFNIVMLVILFMAFCFLVEAILLMTFCRSIGFDLMQALRKPESELIDEFQTELLPIVKINDKFESAKELLNYLNEPSTHKKFHETKFWTRLEVKIFEELFICAHGLPKEFEYGFYISNLFTKYITNIGKFSPITWFTLSIIVIFNYFKTQADNNSENSRKSLYYIFFKLALL